MKPACSPSTVAMKRLRSVASVTRTSGSAGTFGLPLPVHLLGQLRVHIRTRLAQLFDHLTSTQVVLVLAQLALADEAADRDPQADGPLGDLAPPLLVQVERLLDGALEALDQPRQRRQVLLRPEHLGHPVYVGDAEVPGRRPGR